jgi:hypothetical protein
MRINTTQTDKLTIRDTEVENVEQFTYLGSIISTTGRTNEDIKTRKRKAQQAFAMLKPVWNSTILRTSTKLRLFKRELFNIFYFSISDSKLICLSGVDSHRGFFCGLIRGPVCFAISSRRVAWCCISW